MDRLFTRRRFLSHTVVAAGAVGVSRFSQAALSTDGQAAAQRLAIEPVTYEKVTIHDGFWSPRQARIATATLPACIYQTERVSGRIRNFEKAALREGQHEGVHYDDSDVYKAVEAIAYALSRQADAALEKKADEWIDKIVAAQLPDGYINTYYTLNGLQGRWTDMDKHEDFCAGHLIEAGIAYYRSTGKRKLLDAAIRLADYLDATFRVPNRHWVTGHEEIELALMKLYHLTGTERYVKLATWYLDQRGHGYGKGALWGEGRDPAYCQDAVPVKDQREITGHAVRAMYLYSGAADVAAVTGDFGYMRAMKTVWEDVVWRNMYVTGGIGSAGANEGFSKDYDLPNIEAYCETCASVGMVFWNQRMNQMTGDTRYIDVLERTLYNGALSGLSLSGDRFFYGNPLASRDEASPLFGTPGRQEWFGTACCPANVARLVASLGGYIYGASDSGIWINLFVGSSTRVQVRGTGVSLQMESDYPWDGNIKVTLAPERRTRCPLYLRLPGWVRDEATPGDLYRFTNKAAGAVQVLVNGNPVEHREEKGYVAIERTWNKGDAVEMRLPMPVRKVVARSEVVANRDRFALQRGPIVYCVEGADNGKDVWSILADAGATFTVHQQQVLQERVIALRGQVTGASPTAGGTGVQFETRTVTAIPYYAWANRDSFEMQVWLPTKIRAVVIAS